MSLSVIFLFLLMLLFLHYQCGLLHSLLYSDSVSIRWLCLLNVLSLLPLSRSFFFCYAFFGESVSVVSWNDRSCGIHCCVWNVHYFSTLDFWYSLHIWLSCGCRQNSMSIILGRLSQQWNIQRRAKTENNKPILYFLIFKVKHYLR